MQMKRESMAVRSRVHPPGSGPRRSPTDSGGSAGRLWTPTDADGSSKK